MHHTEMVELLRPAVPAGAGVWADFGAGAGNFTRALRALVGAAATLYAIDRDSRALHRQPPDVTTITADFTQTLDLPPLDGLLVANALHWNRDQTDVMRRLAAALRPGGAFVIVEYDVQQRRPHIPFPVPYPRFAALAAEAGLHEPQRAGTRTSPSTGIVMYSAHATRP